MITLRHFFVGNYTEKSIQRVAKSMNMTKVLRNKLVPHYKDWCDIIANLININNTFIQFSSDEPVTKEVLGHRRADWSQQLQIIVRDIQGAEIYKEQPGRKMPGAPGFQRRSTIDFKV